MVDLVADQLDAAAFAVRRQRGQVVRGQHGAGRVGGAGDDQAVDAPVNLAELLQHRHGRLVPGLRAARQLDDLAAQRREDVAVAGVAGAGHRDAVADVEGREEREQEAAGRARGHDHVVRGDGQAVGVAVVRGDAGPQLGQAERDGVAEHVALQRVGGRQADGPGCGGGGLAGREVDQVAVGALPLACGGPDVHDVEGRNRGAGGLVQGRGGSAHASDPTAEHRPLIAVPGARAAPVRLSHRSGDHRPPAWRSFPRRRAARCRCGGATRRAGSSPTAGTRRRGPRPGPGRCPPPTAPGHPWRPPRRRRGAGSPRAARPRPPRRSRRRPAGGCRGSCRRRRPPSPRRRRSTPAVAAAPAFPWRRRSAHRPAGSAAAEGRPGSPGHRSGS